MRVEVRADGHGPTDVERILARLPDWLGLEERTDIRDEDDPCLIAVLPRG